MLNEKLVADLIAKGLDYQWLADMVHRHGPEIVNLLEKALLLGLSPEVTKEALSLAGKIGFEIIVKLLDIRTVFRGETDVNVYDEAIKEVLAKYKD